jgi:hypothetical protein
MIPIPTPIYHFTDIGNLTSIIRDGGLWCCGHLRRTSRAYVDASYQDVQDRRAQVLIPRSPGGTLHDYVPCYFAPRSPMLFTINKGNVPGYPDQSRLVYLVSSIQQVEAAQLQYIFTDGHGIMGVTNFFDSLQDLDKVDWALMGERYWSNTSEDNDRRRRRQAEFLIYRQFPWSLVTEIVAINAAMQRQAQSILQGATHTPIVRIERDWYY